MPAFLMLILSALCLFHISSGQQGSIPNENNIYVVHRRVFACINDLECHSTYKPYLSSES